MSYKDLNKQRKAAREWVEARRKAFFRRKKCSNCGGKKRLLACSQDVNIPEEKVHWSNKDYLEHAKKKRILCTPCFIKEKRMFQPTPVVHGTRDGYKTHKCRCSLCVEAYRKYNRQYRAERKMPKKLRKKAIMMRNLESRIKLKGYDKLFNIAALDPKKQEE